MHPKNCFAYDTTEVPFPDVVISEESVFVFTFDVLLVVLFSFVFLFSIFIVVVAILEVYCFVDDNKLSKIYPFGPLISVTMTVPGCSPDSVA